MIRLAQDLHPDTQAPLHPDTQLHYARTLSFWSVSTVLCALTLHYLTVRAPDSCSLKDEHASNSWSELQIRVVFLLMLQLFFFLTNHCSHPEVRMLLLRNLVPFRFCSKTSESLKAHKLLLSITAPFLFPKLRSPYFQLSTDRTPKTQISAPKASTVADVGFVVAVSDRSKEEMKVMVPMKSKNRWGRRKEEDGDGQGGRKEKKRKFWKRKERNGGGRKWNKWPRILLKNKERITKIMKLPIYP